MSFSLLSFCGYYSECSYLKCHSTDSNYFIFYILLILIMRNDIQLSVILQITIQLNNTQLNDPKLNDTQLNDDQLNDT
jgi:hypothetical protein